nr:hypothetical protein [Acinetobacter bereziniae]
MTAGLSAGGAEAAAPVLSNFLYGKDAKDLTADKKIDKQKNNYYFQALQACTPVIVRIDDKSRDFSHFVVVDGISVRNG